MTLLITGATGFIGRHLCARLTAGEQPVLALMRHPQALAKLRATVDRLGGNSHYLDALPGDLDAPDLGLTGSPPPLDAVVHLGARFGWRLPAEAARRTNVSGSLAVARLARHQHCRLVFISGFMLENQRHLKRLGIDGEDPAAIDWQRVYRRAGAYEASKMEAAITVRWRLRNEDWVEVQPATVAGHSLNGDLDPAQPLHALIDNLARGRLAVVPGGPEHWLPLIPVDTLAAIIDHAIRDPAPPRRILGLDPGTPNLKPMLNLIAETLGCRAPGLHFPIPLLAHLLRLPALARFANTEPEALHFIQPERFDLSATTPFLERTGVRLPPMPQVLRASARHYLESHGRTSEKRQGSR
ncbi:SDR family oxidoreductase [Alloalcanivorax xenomutans]|jgi:nucleoside-diphosphate-sugar epimerase|uniref:SDR family oxidoreductase n=1 Tax=Alloalcanivorax xenomutans TaxID=1094342 RepID=A0A9Q3W2M0_9GAMM|nr:SDR family oxidoreductase [Alloalcanivorax xenomutans]ERS09490.1 NAD dependent epimerase/dehydratase family [Alcanivorax sp. PN-3]KYZ85777.1 NAD-dependent dehydratase [Alcanivorax sp. KX64203]ARB44011.1 NAD-dependent dehydratase [Alloalcanivorax xenomutans]MCE7507381.1 SDR family oxidoreductase [Alloalcanivorax xenomutans]WOA31496.1 SDR family oxidoreductase [Alloalcanivorax xenomutans]